MTGGTQGRLVTGRVFFFRVRQYPREFWYQSGFINLNFGVWGARPRALVTNECSEFLEEVVSQRGNIHICWTPTTALIIHNILFIIAEDYHEGLTSSLRGCPHSSVLQNYGDTYLDQSHPQNWLPNRHPISPVSPINVLRQGYSDMKREPHIIDPFHNRSIPAQGANTATTGIGTMPVSLFCTVRVPGFLAAPALSPTAAATSSTILAQQFAKVPVWVFPGFSYGSAEHSLWQVISKFPLHLAGIHVITI